MPLRNTYTQMTDTGTANGKVRNTPKATGGVTKLAHTPAGTHASNNGAKTVPVLNPNSPLYKSSGVLPTIPDADPTGGNTGGGGGSGGGGRGGRYGRYTTASSSAGGVTGAVDNSAALAAALQAQKQARIDAINAANSALDKQAEAMRGRYDASLQTLANDYQKLRNQAEVNRYRAMFNQREALANRGALDSGAGRQEAMTMQNNYSNNLNAISLQEAAERAAVQQAIDEMYASVENQKAQNMTNGLADYSSALQNLINAQYSGYTPEGSAYYQQALQALGANNGANDSNYTAYLRALGYNV